MALRTNSNVGLIHHQHWGVFTARYAMSPYIKEISLVLKGSIADKIHGILPGICFRIFCIPIFHL